VNGRIMLSGEVADAASLDKAVTIARQFGPEVINAVSVMQPQQVMLEVRFVELNRTAGRELGVQWNRFGGNSITNVGNQVNAGQLPISPAGGSGTFSNAAVGGTNGGSSNVLSSAAVAAGVLSGAAPFGFMISRIATGGVATDPPSTRWSRRALRAVSPSRTWLRFPAIRQASSPAANIQFRSRARSAPSALRSRNTASASPSRRRCCRAVSST
jgi:hypothetical protein